MPGPREPRDPRYDWLYDDEDSGSGPNDPTRPIPRRDQRDPRQDPRQAPPPGRPPQQPPQAPDATRPMPQQPPPGNLPPRHAQPLRQQPPPPVRPTGPPPGSAYPPPRRPRGRVRWGRIILLLLLAYVAFLVAIPVISWGKVERVPFAPAGERPADSPGTTYLVVGSDRRDNLTASQQSELGTGRAGGRRTDTIMLLHVPSNGLPPALISIPRDSYVPIPGRRKNKINASYAFGGPQLLAETIENASGLRIDAYVEIGFGGFVGMVDAVGGVDLCLERAMNDRKAHIDLPAGCQTLEGKNALGYVRARYSDPRGDLGRVERQQEFLAALAGKAVSPATVLNPVRYASFGFATGDAVITGEDTSVIDMARFALAMRTVSGGSGQSLTVPIGNPGLSTRVGSAVAWDREKALQLFRALRNDDPIPPSLVPEKK